MTAAVFQLKHPGIGKTIAFRPVSLELDFDRLLKWQHEPHVIPYWRLNIPEEQYREYLISSLANRNHTLYIGMLDDVPMSYFESYWAAGDRIGQYYEAGEQDQGVHLLIGPPDYLGKGYALPLLQAMVCFQFRHAATDTIVAEPDIRNSRMIHIFKRCGFRFDREVELPEKTAALMFCSRQDFERSWTADDQPATG
ncbi:GNAT family N-acetyltransferase [Paenibacillus tarimensis]|uniref:GNAT family N-acetyltransferase n=1 Tax=Paenibacillus tarimensis TaxID=416012 RepID=UPI001F1641FD|nr:GNAT family N-acetyltransferase [Paenibacillus tarimensis]MCF2945083.1 acetyltransferase [Paenibacillus tarimensis]